MAIATRPIPAKVQRSYISIYYITRSFATSTCRQTGQFHRSDFSNQPFNGVYEPRETTTGPLGGASMVGAPRITPRALKDHLDQFVVGQERAKKVLSVAVYNHYQRIQELQRREDEEEELIAQQQRRELGKRHPVEGNELSLQHLSGGRAELIGSADEFPGQQPTVHLYPPFSQPQPPAPPPGAIIDTTPTTIEKSNVMLLGPSGVGKTLLAKTLARVLDVPFSMSDCTPFTQAGYIGEDAEVCVQRLLAAANYNVAKAERGIIILDEVDKIATAKVSHGKDVSGEGVQQALLKIVEGTTLQIQAKPERSAGGPPNNTRGSSPNMMPGGGFPSSTGIGGGLNPQGPPGGKGEVFNVRTDNILFIFTGAFIGLHKTILDRIAKGSIGFGANVRAAPSASDKPFDTTLKGEDELFRRHVPFYTPATDPITGSSANSEMTYNTLDLVEPGDLQKYGMIPELVGRIPISCALSSLDEEALVRVLTEPRNSLLKQYEQLFSLSGIELRFTSGALREIAKAAGNMGTGARGLRTVMERLLGESMFETPGSPVKHILVNAAAAQRKAPPVYFMRGDKHKFHAMIAEEEAAWEEQRLAQEANGKGSRGPNGIGGPGSGGPAPSVQSFEEYREKRGAFGYN